VFSKEFNLGFGHPATDACTDCAKYKIRITDSNLTDTEKKIRRISIIYLPSSQRALFYDMLGRFAEGHMS